MAVTSAGFKQMCPTCETMVLIKDPRQVGKKMECPKCKDRFIVEAPEEEEPKKNGKAAQVKANGKAAGKTAPAGKAAPGKAAPAGKAKRFREDDDDDDDEPQTKAKGKGKFRDEEEEEDDAPAKKKGGSKKMLPIVLAGVGLVVLIVAAVLILMNSGGGTTPAPAPPPPMPNPMANTNVPKVEEKKDQPGKNTQQPAGAARGLPAAGAELTNLLPNETEHVLHANLKDLFDHANPFRELVFGAGALQNDDLKRKLGFSLLSMDTLIRAERYSGGGWTYAVLHFTEALDQNAVKVAHGLKEAAPINNKHYFQATKGNPWFKEFSRLSLGVALAHRNQPATQNRSMYMHFHNPQTLIVGDEAPIVALLKANSQFKLLTEARAPSATPAQPGPGPGPQQYTPGYTPGQPAPMPGGQPGPMPGLSTPPQPGSLTPPPALPPPMMSSLPPSEHNFAAQEDGDVFGEPQSAQVAPTILAPPLQPGGGGQPVSQPPMGQPIGPMGIGPGPMGQMPIMPMTPGMPQGQQPPTAARSETWLTIDPALKEVLDRLQTRANEARDKVLFASATDLIAARIDTSRVLELKNRVIWHPRQVWDITLLLEERKPRIKTLGAALVQRETRTFQYRSELVCTQEPEARDVHKALVEKAAPQIARSLDRLLGHTVEVPAVQPPANTNFDPEGYQDPMGGMGPTPPVVGPQGFGPQGYQVGPMPGGMGPMGMYPGFNPNQGQKEELAKASKLAFTLHGARVEMKLDLVFDHSGFARLNNLVGLLALTLKSEVDLAGGSYSRHDLATAIKLLGERGLSERGIAPGRYPPAALKRPATTRLEQQPYQRMSWLTGLLPYMGHDALYQKIDFEASWQDPKNWLAARTIVPQLLDPQYPDQARFSTPPNVGVEMATTHVVGIAGVGLDAADYPRDDPAFIARRGVFSYDGSATLDEIRSGRGLSNTAVAIQIPHDGPVGPSPWIAGGGATIRGVPEKNSIAPFVLGADRNGKPIQHNGKRGTYVTMADGSVRFVSANVSDAVFQAMCTVKGPAPGDFDLFKNPDTPLVPKAGAKPQPKPAANPDQPAATSNLTPEGKAFHDGVVRVLSGMQVMEKQSAAALVQAKNDKAQFEATINKIADQSRALINDGRGLKAPPGKEGQEYGAAFKALLDLNEQALDVDVKALVELVRNPTPEAQANLLKSAQAKLGQQQAVMTRLQVAQRAFLAAQNSPTSVPANEQPSKQSTEQLPAPPKAKADQTGAVAPAPLKAAPQAANKPQLTKRTIAQTKSILSSSMLKSDFAGPMTLKEGLGLIHAKLAAQQKAVPIIIDQQAFKEENPEAPDIYETMVNVPDKKEMSVAAVLTAMLDRVPTRNAAYVVREGYVEITTKARSKNKKGILDK